MTGIQVDRRDDEGVLLTFGEEGPPLFERWTNAAIDPNDVAELHFHTAFTAEDVQPVLNAFKFRHRLDTVVGAFAVDRWLPYLPSLTHAPPLMSRVPDGVRLDTLHNAGLQRTLARNASVREAQRVELHSSAPVWLEFQRFVTHLFVQDLDNLRGDVFLRLKEATLTGPVPSDAAPLETTGLPALRYLHLTGEPPAAEDVERIFGGLRRAGCTLTVGGQELPPSGSPPTVTTPPEPSPVVVPTSEPAVVERAPVNLPDLVARGLASPRAATDRLLAEPSEVRGRFLLAVADDAGPHLAFSARHSRLFDPVLSAGVTLENDGLTRLVRHFARGAGYDGRSMNFDLAARSLVALLEAQEGHLPRVLSSAMTKWSWAIRDDALASRLRGRLARQSTPPTVVVSLGDDWGLGVEVWALALPQTLRRRWVDVFAIAAQATRATPSGAWDKRAKASLERVDSPAFTADLLDLLDAVDLQVVRMRSGVNTWFGIDEHNTIVVRGLLWLTRFLEGDDVATRLASIAADGFRKISGMGAANKTLGRAAVFALGELPGKRGVLALTRLRQTVRYATAKRVVEAALERAASQVGETVEDAIETAVPEHGLDATGHRYVPVGEVVAILRVDGQRAVLEWQNPRRKLAQKSVPKAVATAQPDVVKQLRADRKALQNVLTAQPDRLEALYASGRAVPLQVFIERNLVHPLVGTFARRLVWRVVPERGEPITALWEDGALRDLAGHVVEGPASVSLWHPLHDRDPTRVSMLRERLSAAGVAQPFAQAWRPVFHPVEGGVDERFEGFLVEKHILRAVARREGWHYDWHPRNPGDATRTFGSAVVRLRLESASHDAEVMRTAQLVLEGGAESFAAMDALVVSEILLAADRLIARCRIRATTEGALEAALFGPLTSTGHARIGALTAALARLTLPYPCEVDGALVRVIGPVGTAEIHLGTGALRVDGGTRVLKPTKRDVNQAETVFLPFEGDPMVRQILATILAWQAIDTEG